MTGGNRVESLSETIERWTMPQFYVVDDGGDIVFANEESGVDLEARRALPALLARARDRADGSAVLTLSATVVLRAGIIRGTGGIWYAVFREVYGARTIAIDAAQRYRLTPRERQVGELLVTGMTTGNIAGSLKIAPSTVAVHLKNIARKTDSRRRTEMLVKLLDVNTAEA